MQIFPAIDLKDGAAVRLTQGDYAQVQVFSQDPAAVAADFVQRGAKNLHVVDLDGARDGSPANLAAIRTLLAQDNGLFVQVGGGIRDEQRIQNYLQLGVDRVILGTVAVENFDFLEQMLARYGQKIAVSVDARDGKVAVRGWLETTEVDSLAFCKRLAMAGVSTIIYTDIACDGAMQGTNLEIYRLLSQQVGVNVLASGGVSSLEEVKALRSAGIYGTIIGKALYTGALKLEEVLAAC